MGDDATFWQNSRENGLGDWLELDLYEYIDKLVKGFVDTLDVDKLENLSQAASWRKQTLFSREFISLTRAVFEANGQQAVCESLYGGLIGTLKTSDYNLERKWQLLNIAQGILENSPFELKESHLTQIHALVLPLLSASNTTAAHWKSVKEFLHCCTNCA